MKARLSGASDDRYEVSADCLNHAEWGYEPYRIRIVLPGGEEITAELAWDDGWGVDFDVPDHLEVHVEGYDSETDCWEAA